jgi:GT2 family glycosyltransferase
MHASFVIVNYNRKEELLLTINKTKDLIQNYDEDYEIVVVDNGSTDGSAEAVKSSFPEVVLIAEKVNIGAPAWNLGFAKAKGDYFIIIDDDSHIETGLDEALRYIDQRPHIGVLALNILTGPYTSEGWKMQENKNIVGFIGCGAIFRRETYEKIGGYAEWIFLYVNEWELGLRCLNAGYEVQYFAGCTVIHRTSNLHRTTKRFEMLVAKHQLAIIYKYFPYKRWKYITRVVLNNLKAVLKELKFKRAWFILLGVREFLKMRSSLEYTPVSVSVQNLYIKAFPQATDHAFEFVLKYFR